MARWGAVAEAISTGLRTQISAPPARLIHQNVLCGIKSRFPIPAVGGQRPTFGVSCGDHALFSMKETELRFRQIHLDFHTSESTEGKIPEVGG